MDKLRELKLKMLEERMDLLHCDGSASSMLELASIVREIINEMKFDG